MGRRPKELDTAILQAEDFLDLAKKVQDAQERCRVVRHMKFNGRQLSIEDEIEGQYFAEYNNEVDQLIKSVKVIAHNPLFWSEEIPLAYRAGLAVLLDAPLKPERVET